MKNKKITIISLITLSSIIVLETGYIIYNHVQTSKELKNINTTYTNKNDKNDNTETNQIKKIDNTKDWTFNANYDTQGLAESYETKSKEKYYLKDIVVPYLNIDSDYAKSANNEIKDVYDDALKFTKEA